MNWLDISQDIVSYKHKPFKNKYFSLLFSLRHLLLHVLDIRMSRLAGENKSCLQVHIEIISLSLSPASNEYLANTEYRVVPNSMWLALISSLSASSIRKHGHGKFSTLLPFWIRLLWIETSIYDDQVRLLILDIVQICKFWAFIVKLVWKPVSVRPPLFSNLHILNIFWSLLVKGKGNAQIASKVCTKLFWRSFNWYFRISPWHLNLPRQLCF